MKNDVFSLKRFSRYFVTDLCAAISNYGISLLVLASMILTIDLFSGALSSLTSGSWSGIGLGGRSTLMFIFFLAAIISAPSKIYGHITGRKEGTAFLMLPASTLEKFISMVLICAAVVPLAYFVWLPGIFSFFTKIFHCILYIFYCILFFIFILLIFF